MDIVWLVCDSLSFAATSFAADGPDTMPRLKELAQERGTVFTRAYSPGPSSPSSHGSFFTNELPSTTGMHEATPYFTSDHETIAGALSDYESFLISTNPYVFNGLDRDFDESDDLRATQYMVFPEATDPQSFTQRTDYDRGLKRWSAFLFDDGKPVRTFINGVSYKLWFRNQNAAIPRQLSSEETDYQYVSTMNNRIREFRDRADGSTFVVANYMDVHPPFDASDEALERFAGDESREELPIQVAGQDILKAANEGDERAVEQMTKLYHATIWDLDRKMTPFIEELLEEDTAVFVTADHGNWFRRQEEFEPELIHVPLLAFVPGQESETVDQTVNIRHLPTTTMELLDREHPFSGDSLLSVTEDQLSITESIHEAEDDSPVAARGDADSEVLYDIAAVQGDARVEYVNSSFEEVSGDTEACAPLRERIEELVDRGFRSADGKRIEYDDVTEERLKDLGYL